MAGSWFSLVPWRRTTFTATLTKFAPGRVAPVDGGSTRSSCPQRDGQFKFPRKAAPLARKVALAIPRLRPELDRGAWQMLAREWREEG
ncbi:MAG: hypothetical protein O7J95_13325 [Planctomycetota bacterium]|nr:hypothetical protein [Planctomycetota bacterium]